MVLRSVIDQRFSTVFTISQSAQEYKYEADTLKGVERGRLLELGFS